MLLRSKVIPHHSPPTWFHSLAKKGWRSQESKVTWASSWIWDTWLQNLMRSTIGTHQILVLRITGRAYGKKLLQFQVEGAAYCTAVEFAHQPETCENTYTMVRVTQGMSLLSRSILWSTCLTWILAWDSSHLFTVASISLWDLFTNTLILVILFLLLAQHAVPVWVRSLRFCSLHDIRRDSPEQIHWGTGWRTLWQPVHPIKSRAEEAGYYPLPLTAALVAASRQRCFS